MQSISLQLVRTLTVIFLIAGAAFTFTDDAFVDRLVERLNAYNQQFPREKVYVQTDRDTYLPGETIWLKGYLVNAATNSADSASQILYVDLINVLTKRVLLTANLQASAGYAPGYLTLPDSLPAGTYQFRAYTGWMRNFPADCFTKNITLVRPDLQKDQAVIDPTAFDIQFLPEGGQLVTGLNSRVAFKALDVTGKGIAVSGFILNAQRDTVIGFESQRLGMGAFGFAPEAGQTYTAYVHREKGPFKSIALPTPQPQGFTMTVDNVSNKENVRLFIAHTKPISAETKVTLVVQTRGLLVQAAKVPLSKKAFWIQIPRAKFPEGVAQLTLFDETNTPVCERLLFVDHKERLTIQVSPDKATYKPREKVTLDLTVTDEEGKPVTANLSMAVTDTRLAPENELNPQTLTSYLLLSSDVTGTIEQPGYYFDEKNVDRAMHLDLLLMTQGWRRFTWPQVMAPTYPAIKYPVEAGFSLTGQVMKPNHQPAGKVRLTFMLTFKDSTNSFTMGESDEAGRFAAYDLVLTDSVTLMIQAAALKGSNRNFELALDPFTPATVSITKVPFNSLLFRREEWDEFVRRTNEYLDIERQIKRNREVLLKEVTVKAKRKEPEDTRRMMYGRADATVKFDQMNTGSAMTILDVIRSRVSGLQVTGSGPTAVVQIRGAANFQGVIEPLFLIDGMPVSKESALSISVFDVEAVDVLKGASTAMFGSRGAGGVISILMKRGGSTFDPNAKAPGTLISKLVGYQPTREFYAPRYDVSKPEHVRPDYRATLHWAPMIQLNESGKAQVTFFASDAQTQLQILTEGITVEGVPGSIRQVVEVK